MFQIFRVLVLLAGVAVAVLPPCFGQAAAINGEIIVRFGEEDKSCLANLFFSLGELRFANYGYYSIEFAINGRHEASLPLEVRKAIPATV